MRGQRRVIVLGYASERDREEKTNLKNWKVVETPNDLESAVAEFGNLDLWLTYITEERESKCLSKKGALARLTAR